jgi:cobalt-zinc-cadmium efflux system membrane fusion protein
MKHTIYLTLILHLLLAVGCNFSKESEEQEDQDGSVQQDSEEYVELSRAQIETAGIILGGFQSDTISVTIEANGYTELFPNNQVSLNPPIEGFIETIKCIEGETVQKGALLFILRHPGIIKLQEEYIRAVSEYNLAGQEVERQQILSNARVSAQKQYQQATADFQTAKAQMNAIAEQLIFIGIKPEDVTQGKIIQTISVYAPLRGTVSEIYAHKGQLINMGESVMELINADRLLLKLNVFEKNMHQLKAGQELVFTTPSQENSKTYRGHVSFVGKMLDPETRAIRVTSILSEYPELIPGIYVEAKIYSHPINAQVLPDESIVRDADGEYVFLVEPDSEDLDVAGEMTFRKMKVTTGITGDMFTEIINANTFPENSIFVIKGAYYLNSEMNKGELDND